MKISQPNGRQKKISSKSIDKKSTEPSEKAKKET